MEARAFVELTAYIESSVEEGTFFFKLSELRSLYESRLKDFGISKVINKVRFKEQFFHILLKPRHKVMGKTLFWYLRREYRNC